MRLWKVRKSRAQRGRRGPLAGTACARMVENRVSLSHLTSDVSAAAFQAVAGHMHRCMDPVLRAEFVGEHELCRTRTADIGRSAFR